MQLEEKDYFGLIYFDRENNRVSFENEDERKTSKFSLRLVVARQRQTNSTSIKRWRSDFLFPSEILSTWTGVSSRRFDSVSFYHFRCLFVFDGKSFSFSYQICLQLRSDILSGKLPCSFITYALLGSYTAQGELGDYNEFDHGLGFDYLKDLQFAPVQDDELLKRIHEQHQRHK